ncbi:ketimine reductase mu-crystallin [Chironomus tepperi]|uniref:ketimine reductase mu-crystallin n=1 Tax=Chironomus tepperi TaxID=113505 RepID=UPI00391F52C3
MDNNDVIFIKDSVVKSLLNWTDSVDAMESALIAISNTQPSESVPFSSQTPRTFTFAGDKGVLLTMPGYASNYALKSVTGTDTKHSTLSCKLVTSFSGNSQLNPAISTILGTILLFDPDTGKLKAIVDGTEITAWRTAAVSVVATKYLGCDLSLDKGHEGKELAIVGCGTQGRIHALALLNYFPNVFTRVKLWNRTQSRADNLKKELKDLFPNVDITTVDTSVSCVKDADCIVTATNASQPLFELKDLKENVHINAIGAGTNHHSELSMDIYQSSRVYIESNIGLQTELKGIEQYVSGEIGEIVIGKKFLYKMDTDKNVTVFQSMGNAIEDGVMANLMYQKFLKQ